MSAEHTASIIVFRRRVELVEYFFVRRRPVLENDWSPILTLLRPEDTVKAAALRDMAERWRAPSPLQWVDLDVCSGSEVGDLGLVRWFVGYGVDASWEPAVRTLRQEGAGCWLPLGPAFRLLETEEARRAVFRLHVAVAGAA